jgi:sugar phosphate isomerase/epimerase
VSGNSGNSENGVDSGSETPDPRLSRLSLNQMTTRSWTVAEAVAGCARAGLEAIGLWREPVAEIGAKAALSLVTDAGLRVSSLCRGGFLTAPGEAEWRAAVDDNRRAIEEAAVLSAACLVMVVGGLPAGSRDLPAARAQVTRAIEVLAPFAAEHGVRLALEALHPMYCADRSVLCSLGQALDIAEQFPAEAVGVVVDTFQVWWDPQVMAQVKRAGARIASFQICDFLTPLPADVLLARALMGDGHVDFPPLLRAVAAAGYSGDIEVEIFNADVWQRPPDEVLSEIKRRYRGLLADSRLAADNAARVSLPHFPDWQRRP